MTHQITTAASALALFETTKAQRQSFAESLLNDIREGNTDVLKAHMQLKCTEHLLKTINESPEYKKLLLEEAQKNGKKFDMYNAGFEVKEAGAQWDYSKTGDSELVDLEAQAAELKEKIDARKKFLQTIPTTGTVNPDTGEILYRAVKTSTTTVYCTLK